MQCAHKALRTPAAHARRAQFGEVRDAGLLRDVFTGRPAGCGWVVFPTEEQAAAVVERCNVSGLFIVGARPAAARAPA